MGVGYYIELEDENKEIDINVDGNGIGHDQEMLDKIAKEIGVTELSNFFSTSEESVFDLLGEEFDSIDIPDESWFIAKDGLKTVQALLEYIEKNVSEINEHTILDLKDFEKVLKEADSKNVKWHLAIDI